jgi:hypothetical protein
VKYMLMIYSTPESLAAENVDMDALTREVDALIDELTKTGEFLGGQALADPVNSKTVAVRDGVPVVTDGPYLEAKEHLAGYCIFECESLERAIEIAGRWPDAGYRPVELRPLMGGAGMEM